MAKADESIKVTISDYMPIEKALRKFKRLCEAYGVVREYKSDSPATRAYAKRVCFDCHCNEAVWPWYHLLLQLPGLLQVMSARQTGV